MKYNTYHVVQDAATHYDHEARPSAHVGAAAALAVVRCWDATSHCNIQTPEARHGMTQDLQSPATAHNMPAGNRQPRRSARFPVETACYASVTEGSTLLRRRQSWLVEYTTSFIAANDREREMNVTVCRKALMAERVPGTGWEPSLVNIYSLSRLSSSRGK